MNVQNFRHMDLVDWAKILYTNESNADIQACKV